MVRSKFYLSCVIAFFWCLHLPLLHAQVIMESDNHSIEPAGDDWCGEEAKVHVTRKSDGTFLTKLPPEMASVIGTVMTFECPSATTIVPLVPTTSDISANLSQMSTATRPSQTEEVYSGRYFENRFTGFYTTNYVVFDHMDKYMPEYMMVEHQSDGTLFIHSEIESCSGPLVQVGERDMLDPHPLHLTRNQFYGRDLPRSVVEEALPEYFHFSSCPDRQLTVYSMDRSPRIRAYFTRAYEAENRRDIKGDGRRVSYLPIDGPDTQTALSEVRSSYLQELVDKGDSYRENYDNNIDYSDMILAEYRDFIGKKPSVRVRGINVFEFGWFEIVFKGDHRPVFERAYSAEYTQLERIGEAVIFRETSSERPNRTYIIAPYRYGKSTENSLAEAFLGIGINDVTQSDYHMRQLLICEEGTGIWSGIASYKYYGELYLSEQISGNCNYRSLRGIQNILGHFETGGQAGNRDRRSILARVQGGGVTTRINNPCTNAHDYPEFTIYRGAMRARSPEAGGCNRPSEPLEALRTAIDRKPAQAITFTQSPF